VSKPSELIWEVFIEVEIADLSWLSVREEGDLGSIVGGGKQRGRHRLWEW
jgi:hypothetical protein